MFGSKIAHKNHVQSVCGKDDNELFQCKFHAFQGDLNVSLLSHNAAWVFLALSSSQANLFGLLRG